tara:strand:+ start:285 stop:1628 length:1344 start_codon:yes stop_codon:yes gene_type:complete
MARNMETGGQRIFPTFQQIGDNLSNTGTSIVNSLPNKNELTKALRDPEFYSDVGSRAKNMFTSMHPMDQVALTTAPFPILGDVTGLAADARMFSQEPESRTPLNFGLSALGALPFIPAAATIKAFHGTPRIKSEQVRERKPIKAFHGTPHKVDKFSMDKIGTGEGAQSYGHGLYFAESPDVAKQYAQNVPHADVRRNFLDVLPEEAEIDDVMDMLGTGTFSPQQESVIKALNNEDWLGFDYPSQAISQAYRNLDNYDPSPELLKAVDNSSSLYNVNLDVNPEDLLDWDAPLSQQPKKVQDLAKYYNITTTPSGMREARGSDIYTIISKRRQKPPFDSATRNPGTVEGSSFLKEQGIPGLKYYDSMSRGRYGVMLKHKGKNYTDAPVEFATQKQADDYLKESIDKGFEAEHVDIGTRNYVMFDDNLIDIVDPIDDIVNKHNAALDSVK